MILPQDLIRYKGNNNYFSKVVETYKVSNLRTDEVWIKEHYIRGQILVIGCGAGRVIGPLKTEFGSQSIVAIDLNSDMIAEAKKSHPDVKFYEMDAADLKFSDQSFDTVFFPFHGVGYVYPDIYKAVREIHRVLKPGGIGILNTHNRFFLKKLHHFFHGSWSGVGTKTYRTTPLDTFKLRRIFRYVKKIQRIKIAVSWKNSNWKDKLYKIFPFFSKSTFFICFK